MVRPGVRGGEIEHRIVILSAEFGNLVWLPWQNSFFHARELIKQLMQRGVSECIAHRGRWIVWVAVPGEPASERDHEDTEERTEEDNLQAFRYK